MTNAVSYVNMETTNPVLSVAPIKEETEMSGATNKITALYCRLSQEDKRAGEPCPLRIKEVSCSATLGNITFLIRFSLWMMG